MRILLTNDDGITSEGLHVLARAMREHGDVFVVAPDSEYSGAGAAIGPLHLAEPQVREATIDGIDEAWAVAGPPALCVMFARLGAFGDVDLVVSGVNPGANVGRSVYHSGTVGAALTARHTSIPSLAVSQHVTGFGVTNQSWDDLIADQKWHVAAEVASSVIGGMLGDEIGDSPVVNLNVPNLELEQIRGWRFTELGPEPPRAINRVELQPAPNDAGAFNVSMFWGEESSQTPEFDAGAVMNDEISVSYLSRIVALEPPNDSSLGAALTKLLSSS
ncbi:MAG: 5'/3'-nucleotidase SurE [Actinomycetota bacterium]|nr:5'/3'-nucleotidase SurE [Actinomycetota bacterium]